MIKGVEVGGFQVNQLVIFSVEAILCVSLLLGLLRVRSRLGLTPLYVTLGVFQPIQVLLASSLYAEIVPGLVVSPGSVILFTANLSAVLMVYILEDANETRKVIYGIVLANLTMTALLYLFGIHLTAVNTLNILGLSIEIFHQNARVMLAGTVFLFADVILIIFVYEMVCRWIKKNTFITLYLTLAIIAVFDSLGFYTGAFYGQENYTPILVSGIIGKLVMLVLFATGLTIYLKFFEIKDRQTKPFDDVFYALTYRQKYEAERILTEKTKKMHREVEHKYRTLLNNQLDAVFLQKIFPEESSTFIEVNASAINRYGFSRDQLLSMDPSGLFAPTALEEYLSAGVRKELIEKGEIRFESTHVDSAGTYFPVEVSSKIVPLQDGKYILSTVRDVTERKRAENALRESEERVRLVFEASPDIVFIARSDNGEIIEVNRTFERSTGVDRSRAIGSIIDDLDLWTDDSMGKALGKRLQWAGEINKFETDFKLCNGETRSGLLWARLLKLNSDIGILVGIRDITGEKAAELALRELDQTKNEFISMAAHELSTPLSAIMGYTELLLPSRELGDFSGQQKVEFLTEIYRQGESLSRIIDDLLDIRQIEAGHSVSLDLQPVNFSKLLTKVVHSHKGHNSRHTFQLDLSAEPEKLKLSLDPQRIKQVFENLLSNAEKYSPEGSAIIVKGRSVPEGYEVRVEDQGIGMTKAQVDRIFEKFYRADASDTAVGGLGLGMSIVKQIVDSHGGIIRVESTKGKGTTVIVTLPYPQQRESIIQGPRGDTA